MIKATRYFLVFAGYCLFILSSCSKKEVMEVDNETQSAVDYAIADQEFMAVIPAVYHSALITKGASNNDTSLVKSCDSLIFLSGDTADFIPNTTYSLNISNLACASVLPDGKIRSGKLTVRFNGKINVAGSQTIIKLSNYVASGIEYTCDSIVLTTHSADALKGEFGAKLINGSCKTNTINIKYSFNKTVTVYPKGESQASEQVVYAYGNANGTSRQGIKFSTSVEPQDALIKHKTCPFIEKGIMTLTPEGFKSRKIDFGNGSCDSEATFTVNENTVAFRLK